MRKAAILSAVLVLTAVPLALAPLAAQTVLGVRVGAGFARMDYNGIRSVPCFPAEPCPGVAKDWGLSPLLSVDVSRATAIDALNIRFSLTYAAKGGAGSGSDARDLPSSGTLRLHFLQFSPLLEASLPPHEAGRYAVSLLVGPWAGLRVGCGKQGQVAWSCRTQEAPDAGVAFGGGVHYTVASNLTITAESIYHWGLVSHDGGGELTRLVAIQAGVTVSH